MTSQSVSRDSLGSTPWLSILVPAYNAAEFIHECLASVLDQAVPGVEIIVMDDCSTDATLKLVEQQKTLHPEHIRIVRHEKNQGLSISRNDLIDASSGEYLWFLDADDKILPGSIVELHEIVTNCAPDLVLCDYIVYRTSYTPRQIENGELHKKTFAGESGVLLSGSAGLFQGLFEAGHMHAWSKIGRRLVWSDDLRYPGGRYFEDIATMPLLALRAATYYYCRRPWIAYRQWPGSILATMSQRKCVDLMEALAGVSHYIEKGRIALPEKALFAFRYFSAKHFISTIKDLNKLPNDADMESSISRCRHGFLRSVGGDLSQLRRHYFRRSWFWRWQKLTRWERRARRSGMRVAQKQG